MQYSICDFILDIVQNSIEAGSSVVKLTIEENEDIFKVLIQDNGKGMTPETLGRVKDPFYTDGLKHTKRKVGLGIPFLIQAVEAVKGDFDIKSEVAKGTTVLFSFDLSHIDCPFKGDIPGTVLSLMVFDDQYDLKYNHTVDGESFVVSKTELEEVLGNLHKADSMILAKNFLISNEEELLKTEA